MSTLAVRVEPSIVRVQNLDGATLQVMVDNRRGHAGVRIFSMAAILNEPSGRHFRRR